VLQRLGFAAAGNARSVRYRRLALAEEDKAADFSSSGTPNIPPRT
jgi:hypothetical protein